MALAWTPVLVERDREVRRPNSALRPRFSVKPTEALGS